MIPIFMTVDTEGDNLWGWEEGNKITTYNADFVAPFQELCEKYAIVPVYLVNYEMVMSDVFVSYIKDKVQNNLCEIGMHLHAWNSPPETDLKGCFNGNPYITEYSKSDIYEKHKYLRELIMNRIGVTPVTYRAGRWATNEALFDVLEELGFWVDCSITPGINHNAPGRTVKHANNYTKEKCEPYRLRKHLWEIPMTSDIKRSFKGKNIRRKLINLLRGEQRWLRPALQTDVEMLELIHDILDNGCSYLMFMIHSSELMPGGSPYCSSETDVELFLDKLEKVFLKVKNTCEGYAIKDYYSMFLEV